MPRRSVCRPNVALRAAPYRGAFAAGSEEALLAWLEVAGDADPLNPVLPAARGVLLERLGRRSEAIDALEAATALAPDAPLPAALLGNVLARSNRLREAEAALRRAERARSRQSMNFATCTPRCCCACIVMQRHATELLACIERHGEQVR